MWRGFSHIRLGFCGYADKFTLQMAATEDSPWRGYLIRGEVHDGNAFLEGPFLNPAKKGAMPADCLFLPDREMMDRWLALGRGHVRQVTIAPELPGALPLIRYLAEQGLVVTGGHTDATYEESLAGIDAGITVANHTFNAMRGLNHRSPGAVGAYWRWQPRGWTAPP